MLSENPRNNLEAACAADIDEFRHYNAKRIEFAVAAGEKLATLREGAQHGEWLPLLTRLALTKTTAWRWMAVASAGFKRSTVERLGLRRAGDLVGALDRAWPQWKACADGVTAMALERPDEPAQAFALAARGRFHLRELRAHVEARGEHVAALEALVEANPELAEEWAEQVRKGRAEYEADAKLFNMTGAPMA